MVRWDALLFTIPWDDPTPPLKPISDAGIMKPPNIIPQIAHQAPTDALRTLEHTTSALVPALMVAQAPRTYVEDQLVSAVSVQEP
ncbi:hypothetical protein EDB19DRAFT_1755295 [Suillus lakei]|nr:hypothetical protein EDB19DRAFT_1755295 [Suillus lakei]